MILLSITSAAGIENLDRMLAPMIDSQRKNKAHKLPLQFDDTEKVINNAADYQRDEANDILVHIPVDTEGFTAFASFDITLKKLSISNTPVDLLECWIDWPPTEQPAEWGINPREALEGDHPNKLPMIIRDIVGPEGVEVDLDTDKEKVTVRAKSICASTLQIKFKVPNVFFNLPGRPPFVQKRLTVNLKVLNGAASSVLQLEYPKSIAMRARADNAEYQSLVLSIDDNYFRKATFFPQKEIHIRYTFGTTDGVALAAPGFPPLRAGLALLGFGFTLLLIHVGLTSRDEGLFDLAAVAFALSLIPSFIEMFRIRSLFSHSAAVADTVSWERRSAMFSGAVHLYALILVVSTLLLLPSQVFWVPGILFGLVGGTLVLGAWILYFLPLFLGTYHKYWCDRCERRTWIRRQFPERIEAILHHIHLNTKLHHDTRHSLCARCYDDVSKDHLEYKSPPQDALPPPDDGHPSSGDTANGTLESGTTSNELEDREQEAWRDVLAGDVHVNPLPGYVDSGVIENLKDMHLELRFVPTLKLKRVGDDVQEYLEELKARYPKWSNVRKLYWELVRDEKFNFPTLAGQWLAVEVEAEPAIGDRYPTTPLAAELGFENSRSNASWNSIHDAIGRERQRILCKMGLPTERTNLRLLEALEWNLLANRHGWGTTDTWEWTNTKFRGDGHMRVIVVGNSKHGGAGCMSSRSPVRSQKDLGFRAVIVLGP